MNFVTLSHATPRSSIVSTQNSPDKQSLLILDIFNDLRNFIEPTKPSSNSSLYIFPLVFFLTIGFLHSLHKLKGGDHGDLWVLSEVPNPCCLWVFVFLLLFHFAVYLSAVLVVVQAAFICTLYFILFFFLKSGDY